MRPIASVFGSVFGVLLAALTVSACAADARVDDGPDEASECTPIPPGAATESWDWLIREPQVPAVAPDGTIVGLDLDGRPDPVCGQDDLDGAPPGDAVGVDVNLPKASLLAGSLNGHYATWFGYGRAAWLVRVTRAVDAPGACPAVEIVGARTADGEQARLADGTVRDTAYTPVAADDWDHLDWPEPTVRVLSDDLLEATFGDVALPTQVGGHRLPWPARDLRIRLRLTADGGEAVVGLGADIDAILAFLETHPNPPAPPSAFEGLMRPIADLAPDADGVCQWVSVSLVADVVPVERVDAPPG